MTRLIDATMEKTIIDERKRLLEQNGEVELDFKKGE